MITANLVWALREVLRSEEEEKNARKAYNGYDWSYHGHRYAEASRFASEVFQATLDAAIDARMEVYFINRPTGHNQETQ